jgi:hypothetical protein
MQVYLLFERPNYSNTRAAAVERVKGTILDERKQVPLRQLSDPCEQRTQY